MAADFGLFFIRYSFFPLPGYTASFIIRCLPKKKLEKIQKAEQLLCENGFPVNRVRMHDTIARIEIPSEQFSHFIKSQI